MFRGLSIIKRLSGLSFQQVTESPIYILTR